MASRFVTRRRRERTVPAHAWSGRWPFDPATAPFYYGWVVLVVGTIGSIASTPGQTAGVSVFTGPLVDATGLTRLQLSIAYLIGTGASGFLLPKGGLAIDGWGSRRVAFAATVGLSATLVGLSLVANLGTVAGLVMMSVGFACLRFSGQGMLTLSSRTMVAQWFERRRGLVSSVSNAGAGFAMSAGPALFLQLIESFGFRWAWRLIAAGLALSVGLIVAVFYRDTPEGCGLRVDGGPRRGDLADADTTTDEAIAETGATRAEAARDPRFWAITSQVMALAAVSTALTFHIVDLGADLGLDDAEVVRIFVPIAFVTIPVTFLTGWLVDKINPLAIAVVMGAAQVLMYLSVPQLATPAGFAATAVGWGTAQGCAGTLTSAALPRLFGRRHLGAIGGLQMSAMVIGSALGPVFFALIKSLTDSYTPALWLLATIPTVGAVLAIASTRRNPTPS